MKKLGTGLLLVAILLLLATYSGSLHPAGDSLAVGRPLLAALILIIGLVRRGALGWTAVAIAAVPMIAVLWAALPRPRTSTDGDLGFVVYQKNLLFTLADPARIIADIRSSDPDIVLLQEVSRRNLAVPKALQDILPHQAICSDHPVGAVAVLSRFEFENDPICHEAAGMVAVRLNTPRKIITAVSLHLHWPWPFGQANHLDRLVETINELPQPMIVGGDFNAVPGSMAVRRVEAASKTKRILPLRPTFHLKGLLPITIDHVLASLDSISDVEVRAKLGSDHHGQVARIDLYPNP